MTTIWTGGGVVLPIISDFVPNTSGTYSIGSTSLRWKDLWLSGDITAGGDVSVGDDLTVTDLTNTARLGVGTISPSTIAEVRSDADSDTALMVSNLGTVASGYASVIFKTQSYSDAGKVFVNATGNSSGFGTNTFNVRARFDLAIYSQAAGYNRVIINQYGLNLGIGAILATTTTSGFVYIPYCSGAPTGVPTAQTGSLPMIFDATNSKIWIYIGGVWKGVVVA